MLKTIFIVVVALVICICVLFPLDFKEKEYFNTKKPEIVHLFWTGGYDSTFRLCQALIDENKIVQPYYMIVKVDNCKKCKFERQNRGKELETMNKIINHLKKKYPVKSKNLRKLKLIKHIPANSYITNTFYNLKLHNYRRRYNQYEAMCRYANANNKMMEVGTVGIFGQGNGKRPNDGWGTYLRNNLVNNKGNFSVIDPKSPIHNLRFPVVFISKKDMLTIAKRNGYEDVVRSSWSCWFPQNGKPCKKCLMCIDRVIP